MAGQAKQTRCARRRRRLIAIAAAVCGIADFVRSACGQTTAEWLNTSGGSWTTGANWSTSPNYPNNGTPAGATYDALFDQAGTGPYIATLSSAVAVTGISIDTANATLTDAFGTLTVGGLGITSGVFQLSGGTLSGGTSGAVVTLSSASQFILNSGILNNLTFAGSNLNFNAGRTLEISNGLNLSDYALNMTTPTQSPTVDSLLFFGGPQTIDDLSIDATAAAQSILYLLSTPSTGTETLTDGPNANIHGNLTFNSFNSGGSDLINDGVLNADISAQTLGVKVTSVVFHK